MTDAINYDSNREQCIGMHMTSGEKVEIGKAYMMSKKFTLLSSGHNRKA